ncbi:uncharacterized protein LOC144450747 [Glandiceps talaboti]
MKHMTVDGVSKHQLKKSPYNRRHTSPSIQIADEITATKQDREIEYEKGNAQRRTIVVKQRHGSYGFHLESYRIYHKSTGETEIITFISHVDYDGPAYIAGMRQGDVIVSVNGITVFHLEHEKIVAAVRSSHGNDLRLVVVFEDYVERIKLQRKLQKLKSQMRAKQEEVRKLTIQENAILKRHDRPVSLTSQSSFSNMSAIIDVMNSTSLDPKWPYEAATGNHGNRTSQSMPTSISSLPIMKPSRELSTSSLDRTISGTSISTSSSQEGIVFSAKSENHDTDNTNHTTVPSINIPQPELKSPDSGYHDNNEHTANQRDSHPFNEEEEETYFSFSNDKAQLLQDSDDRLPRNEDEEDTVL